MVEDGAIVYALDKDPVSLPVTKYIPCNLADKRSIDSAFLYIPDKIDCFFGVAGVSGIHDDYYTTFTVNFIANKYITDEYLKDRMASGGSICYVSSVAGNNWEKYASEFRSFIKANSWDKMIDLLKKKDPETLGILAYPLSKRALNYYTSLMAIELGGRNIRVNAIVPAATETNMMNDFLKESVGKDEIIAETGVASRLALAEEIAKPMLFISSDMASFISGTCFNIDYGNDSMIKLGKKRDRLDMKVSSKLFNLGFVQNQLKKHIEPIQNNDDDVTVVRAKEESEFDSDGIEII